MRDDLCLDCSKLTGGACGKHSGTIFYSTPETPTKVGLMLKEVETRLKTLEEKIEFIMEKVAPNAIVGDNIGLKTLKDLWDEENEEHLEKEVIKEFIKPSVKEENGFEESGNEFDNKEGGFDAEVYLHQRNKGIREQIKNLRNANLDDYYIDKDDNVIKGKPDVITGKLYGLNCGYISESKEDKINKILDTVLDIIPVDNEAEMGGVLNFASWGVVDKESFAVGFRKGYEMHTEETKRAVRQGLKDKLNEL